MLLIDRIESVNPERGKIYRTLLEYMQKGDQNSLKGMLTIGFELETQITDGFAIREYSPKKKFKRVMDDRQSIEYIKSDPALYMSELEEETNPLPQFGIDAKNVWNTELFDVLVPDIQNIILDQRNRSVERAWKNNISKQKDIAPFFKGVTSLVPDYELISNDDEDIEDTVGGLEGIDVKTDGSVCGFEFVASDPVKYSQLSNILDSLFSRDHFVDEGCSFHIHLGLPGITSTFHTSLQAAFYHALEGNVSKLPTRVLERLLHEKCQEFAPFRSVDTKYTAVNCHSLGTWEFRLFGNIDTKEDAQACIDIAITSYFEGVSSRLLMDEVEAGNISWSSIDTTRILDKVQSELTNRQLLSIVV